MDSDVLLQIESLKTYFHGEGGVVKAVDDLSLTLKKGQTIGIVGESGSGKSVTSLSVLRLLPPASAKIAGGAISYLGRDLVQLPERQMRDLRGCEISMIFQEPGTSLNPVFTVGEQVNEVLRLHEKLTNSQATQRTLQLFEEVGIPDPAGRIHSYPHEMSGGQKQRVMIAMALACNQTKIFNMVFSDSLSSLRRQGSAATHHTLTHEEPVDEKLGYQPQATYFVERSMDAWGQFLATLDAIPEGDGTLLDHCLVFAHTDTAYAKVHSIDGIPLMLAGSGAGKVKTGLHLNGNGDPITRVGLTAMQMMGLPLEKWGTRSLQTSKTITEILA